MNLNKHLENECNTFRQVFDDECKTLEKSILERPEVDSFKQNSNHESIIDNHLDYTLNKIQHKQHSDVAPKPNQGFQSKFKLIKVREGYVESINESEISSKLFDAEDSTYDIFEFDIDDVEKDDISLLKSGALFYLYLGYYKTEHGTIKYSKIEFRRFPIETYLNDGLDSINENQYLDIWE